jgi:NAD(P)-dependent dehydrogenase (short-subunit alcohol dehydrogenase family)
VAKSLKGKVAIVTGGARGIGAATSVELARHGCDISIVDIRPGEEGQAVAAEIIALGQRAHIVTADITKVPECRRSAENTVAALGKLDVLINNAGGGLSLYHRLEEVTEQIYDRILDVNLKGAFFMTQAAIPYIRSSDCGRVINLASELAFLGYELMIPYTAAKGGIVAMTRSLARALAPNITVNAVAPGATATEGFKKQRWYLEERAQHEANILLRRFGEPMETASVIAFLAGSGGSYCTGQTFNVNGGVIMP